MTDAEQIKTLVGIPPKELASLRSEVDKLTTENARLRRQVERLAGLVRDVIEYADAYHEAKFWNTLPKRINAIFADEPDAATAIDKAAKTTENTGG